MTNEAPDVSKSVPASTAFTDKVQPLLTDLLYPSESDEPIDVVTCYLKQPEPLIVTQIKEWLLLPPSVYVAETPEADFWEPVVTQQDWYGDEEKARTDKFGQLKEAIEHTLTVRQIFRVGDTEIDVYLLGLQENGERAGIKTKVVQT